MKKYELIYADPPWRYRSGKVQGAAITITLQCQMRNYISFPLQKSQQIIVYCFLVGNLSEAPGSPSSD